MLLHCDCALISFSGNADSNAAPAGGDITESASLEKQIRVLPDCFRLLSKLRVFRADETPLEVPPREVIKLGAQAVVEFMADLVAKRDNKAAPPKKEKGFWFRICSICWPFRTANTDDNM
ncbi:hypothetical protein GOBAR_DD08551 [Gossypium barbadense]|nr:hypothetical protein GOBAR_DD08551 [Gossypium barbadense]